MALTLQPVRNLSDVQANFDKAAALFKHLSGVNLGIASMTWPGGGANSNAIVVPHGLAVVPYVLALPLNGAGGLTQNFTVPLVTARTTSDFTLLVRTQDSSITAEHRDAAGDVGRVRLMAPLPVSRP